MKKVEKIGFIFENCEFIDIPVKFINDFCLSDFETEIQRMGINYIGASKTANTCIVSISKEANKLYKPFDVEDFEESNIFDRITGHQDITAIELTYEDGSVESIFVDYDEEQEDVLGSPNKNMDTVINNDGNLFITICKDKKIPDLFSVEDLSDGSFDLFNRLNAEDEDDNEVINDLRAKINNIICSKQQKK